MMEKDFEKQELQDVESLSSVVRMLKSKSHELETLKQENKIMSTKYQQKLAHLDDQDRYMRKKLLKLEQDNRFLNDTIYDLNTEL
jgi:hypothetical protein